MLTSDSKDVDSTQKEAKFHAASKLENIDVRSK